jgi:ATP-dependent helicase/nuclease subunit A
MAATEVTLAQRDAADPGASVWVAASAGAGKTKALTDRVLRLLLDGAAPQRLLCLTFTRAAAAEMANRVNGQLGEWTMMDDGALDAALETLTGTASTDALRQRARRQFATVLDTPGRLKILTIHAFCQSLLGRFPLEAGVAPHFQVLTERDADALLAEAQTDILARARGGDDAALAAAVDVIALHVGEESFAEVMAKLRGARDRLRRLFDQPGGLEGVIAETYDLVATEPGVSGEQIVAQACADGAFNRSALQAACAALDSGSESDRKRSAVIARWLAAPEGQRITEFDDYRRVFLTAEEQPRKEGGLMTKGPREKNPDAFEAMITEQEGLVQTIARRNAAIVAEATTALLRLGGAMLAEYDRRKGLLARLDYDDLILKAARLLDDGAGGAAWVLYKLDGGIDHILVDEAQDTSPEQWRVVAALAEEFFAGKGAHDGTRTLFVVGDEKQSIFSFQGADLRALEAMRELFHERVVAASETWREVGLETSFRSTAVVLEAVDTVFASPAARDGVAFADHAIRHTAHRADHAGRVELWPLATESGDDAGEPWLPPVSRRARHGASARLAQHMASTIHHWIESGERLEARDRPIRAGDIMVLVRTRGAIVEELVRALKSLNVPVAGADRMVLTDQLAVMDLAALGEFLLLPEDDLTLATVLRGPLIGLDEEQLFDLAHDRGPEHLWRTLVRRRGENETYCAAYVALSELLARADFVPPYELFADVLGARGGRRKLVARLGPDANDPIDEFLALTLAFERDGPPSLQGFLHWLAAGDDVQVKRDMEQGRDEVRVMTVHGAKGLQAPIVFLPDTTSLPSAGGVQVLWHGEGEDERLLWPGRSAYDEARCRHARQAMRERELQEYRRLLYVAMTRAEDRLYIAGWQGKKKPAAGCWYELMESALAPVAKPLDFEAWEGDAYVMAGAQTREPRIETSVAAEVADDSPLETFALTPAPPEPAPPRPLAPSHAPSQGAEAEPPVISPLTAGAEDNRFRRGRVIHRLLQLLPEVPADDRPEACTRLLDRAAPGMAANEREQIAGEVAEILGDNQFAALFGPGSRAEVPLIGLLGETVVSGQVDRLVVGEQEVMVIDYKTNRPPPHDEAGVAPGYIFQMATYRAVLARIYPGKSIRCALLWTDGPRLMALSDEVLDHDAP